MRGLYNRALKLVEGCFFVEVNVVIAQDGGDLVTMCLCGGAKGGNDDEMLLSGIGAKCLATSLSMSRSSKARSGAADLSPQTRPPCPAAAPSPRFCHASSK